MRWIQDPTMGDLELKLTHNDRDKGGHEAQVLEDSKEYFSYDLVPKARKSIK